MTVKELYLKFSERIPDELRCEWDNDGLMCSADTSAEVRRALIVLDVTEEIVDYARDEDFDLIVSHHPLIFRPLSAITDENHVARKVSKLITSGISVFSFHTRADRVTGGVNDQLCDLMGIYDTEPFGEDCLGRLFQLEEEMTLEDFAYKVKVATGADTVKYADGYNAVSKVAVVGGDGKDYVRSALRAGADTFLSGRIGYNVMAEAAEMGINLIEAGHFFTEQPVTSFFRSIINKADASIYTEILSSNNITAI